MEGTSWLSSGLNQLGCSSGPEQEGERQESCFQAQNNGRFPRCFNCKVIDKHHGCGAPSRETLSLSSPGPGGRSRWLTSVSIVIIIFLI